jgi:dienelactone hydrolase
METHRLNKMLNFQKMNLFKYIFLFIVLLSLGNAQAQVKDSLGFQSLNDQVMFKIDLIDKPAPTIILIHGGSGVRASNNMNVWAYIVKSWGYNVVTIDLFSKRGFYDLSNRGTKLSFVTRSNDVIELAEFISQQPWHKGGIGTIGFSQGGSTVFRLAKEKDQKVISAGVAFYPGCTLEPTAYRPGIPIQIHFAMKDDVAIPSQCGPSFLLKNYEVHRYENASHTFDIAAEKRVGPHGGVIWHDAEAFQLSQQRTRQFFDSHLER